MHVYLTMGHRKKLPSAVKSYHRLIGCGVKVSSGTSTSYKFHCLALLCDVPYRLSQQPRQVSFSVRPCVSMQSLQRHLVFGEHSDETINGARDKGFLSEPQRCYAFFAFWSGCPSFLCSVLHHPSPVLLHFSRIGQFFHTLLRWSAQFSFRTHQLFSTPRWFLAASDSLRFFSRVSSLLSAVHRLVSALSTPKKPNSFFSPFGSKKTHFWQYRYF